MKFIIVRNTIINLQFIILIFIESNKQISIKYSDGHVTTLVNTIDNEQAAKFIFSHIITFLRSSDILSLDLDPLIEK